MVFDSNRFTSNNVRIMPPSGIRKYFDLAAERKDIISLSIGEPDFITPDIGQNAAIRSLLDGHTAYTANSGLLELRQSISEYLTRSYAIDYDPHEEIIITVGGSEGIDLALWSLINPGDEVLIPEPCFVSYGPCATLTGGVPVMVPCTMENGFKVQIEDLEKSVTDKTKILLISYPSNPTGVTLVKSDLEKIAAFAIKHDLVVICDEIYAEVSYGIKHTSLASLPKMHERTILISGASKAFAMTGWRIGYACAPKDFIDPMLKIHQYILMCAPTISQYAALACFQYGDHEVEKMLDEYNRRRLYIIDRFRSMGLDVVDPQGAFYAFPSIKKTGLSSEEFALRLLNEQGVAVVPGNAFGQSGEGYIRCSYAASLDKIATACDRMECFLEKLL